MNSKCFSRDIKETQAFREYYAESYKYFTIPVKIEQKSFLLLSTRRGEMKSDKNLKISFCTPVSKILT